MHEYFTLKEAITGLGISPSLEELHPDDFGNAFCIFDVGVETPFRLIWDGKDGCGFLQTPDGSGGWSDAGPFLPEGAYPGSDQFQAFVSKAYSLAFGHERPNYSMQPTVPLRGPAADVERWRS